MSKKYNIVILMTEENIHGREIVSLLKERKHLIDRVIVEQGSQLANNCKKYLANDFYSPKRVTELIGSEKTFFVSNHNQESCVNILKSVSPDIIILGGTRILKREVLETARIGVLNAHPGLLPKYRGLDVVAWQILNGDPVGATCHLVNTGVDAGPILIKRELKFKEGDSLLKIRVENMRLCAALICEAIENFERISPQKQDESNACRYAEMDPVSLEKVESMLKR